MLVVNYSKILNIDTDTKPLTNPGIDTLPIILETGGYQNNKIMCKIRLKKPTFFKNTQSMS